MDQRQNRSTLIFGAILIAVGVLLLVGRVFDWGSLGFVWPVIVMGAGLIFFIGMVLAGKSAGPLAVPGSIITTIGLILLLQNLLGWWETWSYAWGLVISAVGVGLVIYGAWSDIPELRKRGWEVARVGLILFVIFGAIFELLFSFGQVTNRGGQLFWAGVLILVGLVQLGLRIFRLARKGEAASGDDRDLFGPIFLIGFGVLAALIVSGIVPLSRLGSIVALWPLLLIAAGLQLFFGRKTAWSSALIGILLVAAVLFVALAGEQLGIQPSVDWLIFGTQLSGDENAVKIIGSGEIISERRALEGYDQIILNTVGQLTIVQGTTEELVIRADDNLLDYITTDLRGGRLVIGFERSYLPQPTQEIIYQVNVKNLREIRLSGAGNVNMDGLQTNDLDLEINGAGSVLLTGLRADEIHCEINGSGSLEIAGRVDELDIEISGSGRVNAPDLESRRAEISLTGLGDITVWVTGELITRVSGAGSVSYYGDPIVRQGSGGIGMIRRLGDK
jgi:hypothetical protein